MTENQTINFSEINNKREHDGWLDEKGKFYNCQCHISWIELGLEFDNEELFNEYEKWFSSRENRGETGIEFLMKQHGWWKRSSIADSRLWLGETSATPAQRRYINRDMGERQSNEYFAKGY